MSTFPGVTAIRMRASIDQLGLIVVNRATRPNDRFQSDADRGPHPRVARSSGSAALLDAKQASSPYAISAISYQKKSDLAGST